MKAEDVAKWLEGIAIDPGGGFRRRAAAIRAVIEERDRLDADLSATETEVQEYASHVARLREALQGLLLHPGVADMDPEDKSPEDIEAERSARAALEPKP